MTAEEDEQEVRATEQAIWSAVWAEAWADRSHIRTLTEPLSEGGFKTTPVSDADIASACAEEAERAVFAWRADRARHRLPPTPAGADATPLTPLVTAVRMLLANPWGQGSGPLWDALRAALVAAEASR